MHCDVAGCAQRQVRESPAKKLLMLGRTLMSELGVVVSPVAITLVSKTSEVFEINFWDSIAIIFRT